jgi:hypothetical protein
MTQAQYQWLKDNGYDPAVYDVDQEGNIFENPIAAPATQQKMSPLRAAGTSFLGNLLPAGAGLGAGSLLAPLALSNPWTGIPTVIAGSLAAGYGTGKLQEKALEEFAPEALQQMAQAEQDQPVASWAGGSAPALLTFKPTLKGIEGLSAPLMGGANKMARFAPAAVNVGVNAANAGAGQLLNMSQGGEFSAPRFLADTALGAVLANPNALGRRMGFHPLTPESGPVERLDLAGENARRAGVVNENARAAALAEDQAASARATELLKQDLPGLAEMSGPDARRFQLFENEKAITGMFDQLGLEKNPELIQDLVNDPLLSNFRNDPEALRDYVMQKTGLNRQAAASARQAKAAAFEAEYAGRRTDLGTEPTTKPYEPQDIRRESIAANRKAIQEVLNRMKANPPEEFVQDLANDPFVGNLRNDPQAFQDFIAGKADKYLESSWRKSLGEIDETTRRLEESMAKEEVAEFDREQARRAEARNLGIKDIQPAREAAEEIHQRFQRPGEEGTARITQEDLDVAAQIAARRGLKLTFADLEGGRGSFRLVTKDGVPLIEIDPAAATRDTAIHEIGHDVYARSVGERMKRGLMATAEDSPAFKAEFEARMAARDEQGNPVHTEQQARDLALEEGVIQSFGERYPNVKPGEIRQWFNALKASVKDLMGMKLSPEDAAAYLHYMTHEAVPWKGAAAVKTGDVGEERLQRAQQGTPEFKAWFGDSKVVDAEGKPLRVYTGTSKDVDFTSFKAPKNGIWFAADPEIASNYAMQNDSMDYKQIPGTWKMQQVNTASRVIPAYVSLKNPAMFEVWPDVIRYATNYKKALGDYFTQLKAQGHDGVIFGSGKDTTYVAFNPEQVKSALGNKGTFDPLNKDIRYQRGPTNRLRNFSEVDSLESRGGIFSQVAQGMRSYYATRKFMQGQASAKEQAMSALSPERQVMLGKHIGQEFDQQRFIQPPSEIAAAYNEYRNEWQKFWPTETNKAGHTVRTAGGQRARLTDPYYGPFHMWSDSVRDIITTKQGSPEYVKLKDDYVKQHVQFHQQNGVPLQEAQTRAIAEFNDAIREMSVPYDPTAVGTFAGARKAQGIPLPDSWREYNIMKLVENYDRRSAMDYAMQEHMEKSPEIMAALGAEKYFNDQPIPPQIKASVPYIGDDNSVKSILREMSGKPAHRPDELASGASRGIGALTIGTVSKATEVPTTMIAGLRYLQMSDYLPGTMKFIEKLADWSALQERSYASGLNKRDGAQNMRQVAGVIGDASGYMNKFAETVSKYTGLNTLEKAARTMAQGWGEVLVQINKRKAATGDKEAVRMLDTLSPDWRTRSDADLAGQFGQLMQGSYDMTQLPAWMLESGAAPYLTWSKWSAGQYNSFMKFAIEPALQGNVKPLLGHLLIGVMGGAAVEQIREWMNNREGRDVNWNELESWMQQNQGELGAEGMKQLSVKLLNMVQNVGTFGIAGDLAKMVTTAAVGGTAQGMATAPVANAVFDTSKKVAAALKAIDDGEDFGLVLRQMMMDVAKSHVQVARVGQNWLDEDENLRYDDRRKRRLFDELTGAPTQAGTFSVNYGNLAEREFERGEITPQTGEEALGLVTRAREQATSPEDYASRIRKYKTSQNQIMPSLERQPMKAARYLSFVEGAEEGAGAETMRRYLTREYENKYRKSLIEGMSGIR